MCSAGVVGSRYCAFVLPAPAVVCCAVCGVEGRVLYYFNVVFFALLWLYRDVINDVITKRRKAAFQVSAVTQIL